MPTKTIVLLAAIFGIIVLIVISIIVTVIVTGNFLAKKGEKGLDRPNSNFLLYVKNVDNYKCPLCGGDLKLYLGKDQRTYYRCKNMDHCSYMVNPDDLIGKKNG